jgi:hypothetical protein
MARFGRALVGEELLNPAFTQIMLTGKVPLPPPPGPPPAGRPPLVGFQCHGPQTLLLNNQWAIGHGGGSFGESTEIQLYPASEWVSVILSNYDHPMGVVPPIHAMARDLITGGKPR